MDGDGSNNITVREFQEGLEMSGVEPLPSEAELRRIFKAIDIDHSRGVSFNEFKAAFETPQKKKPKPEPPKETPPPLPSPPPPAPLELKVSAMLSSPAAEEPHEPPVSGAVDTWREEVMLALQTTTTPFRQVLSPTIHLIAV